MRILFVRHGHPNYELDCLTELGHLQAQAAAQRLTGEGIDMILASSSGRARETAEHTAKALSLPVRTFDFMREIWWGSVDDEPLEDNGQPWVIADRMAAANESLMREDWAASPRFARNRLVAHTQMIAQELDKLLLELGYARDGLYYRAVGETDRTVAIFSHGGSSSAMISHMLNLPFPFVCGTMGPDFTAVTVLTMDNDHDRTFTPKIELLGDARHIRGLDAEKFYGR